MSLKAWYPLDGNTINYGVGQLTPVVSTTPTYVSGGKIGAKALSTGGLKWTATQTASILNNTAISFAFWIKPINTTAGQIFGTSGMGENNNRKFAIFAYPTGNDLHLSWMNDAASTTFMGGVYSGVFPANTWTHCCITYQNPTMKVYINGVLKATATGISSSSSFAYETPVIHNSANRYINDFRVYDHCLTPREVKLISQGLILHLPLRDQMVESTINLSPYPTPGTSITTSYAWDQNLHSEAISVYGWGAGYNGGVSTNGVKNAEIGYHAHWQLIDGIPTMVFPNINSLFSAGGRWLGISGAGGLQDDIGAGGTYTVSFDAKGSVDGMTINSGYYYRITGGTSNAFHDGQKNFTLSTTWKRYSYTYTTKDTINTAVSGSFYFYGHYGIEGISYVRNIQIELKDHATAYTKDSRNSILMDCSGYGRHGTTVGTLVPKDDSARNSSCIYITDGRSNYGKSGTFTMPTDQITMSCWIKSTATGYSSYHIPLSFNASDYEFSIDSSGKFRNGFKVAGSRSVLTTNHTSILDGQWHMITATYDGATIRRYVDGVELTSYATSVTGSLAGGSSNLLIGNYNSTTYGNKETSMSDVRIYSTALSADDIAILYKSRIAMLEDGSIITYEYHEDSPGRLKMGADGLIRAGNLSEIGFIADMKVKTLADGSAWARIHWLDVTNDKTFFANATEVANCSTTNRYSKMGIVDKFKDTNGYYEFMLTYPSLSKTLYNRWKQTNSPNAAHKGGTGHVKITTAWSNYSDPLTKSGTQGSAIYATNTAGNWWAPIGQIASFSGGIPAADGSTQYETELWVRIDTLSSLTKLSVFEDQYLQAFQIYEI